MSEKVQGDENYIPTRLEWLALVLNVNFELDDVNRDRFYLFYSQGKEKNTINISVNYYSDVNKEYMNRRIRGAEEIVSSVAKAYGWDSWLEVKINLQEIK